MEAYFIDDILSVEEGDCSPMEVVQGRLEECGSLETSVTYTVTFITEASVSTANITDIQLPTADIFFQPSDTTLNKTLDFCVHIENDCVLESSEMVLLVLGGADDGPSAVGSPSAAVLEIEDNDSKFFNLAVFMCK